MIHIARSFTRAASSSGVLQGLCVVWACVLGMPVSAQSASPRELASNAMASPAVKAVLNAQNKSGVPTTRGNPADDHEAHLAAIRQAILNATMDRPTRVISTAWVDQHGALHESAHFHSEAKVSGIRVLSYLPHDESPPQITADVLPWGYQTHKSDKSCTPAPRAWRLTMAAHPHALQGFSGPQLYAGQTLLKLAQDAWLQSMQPSQRWHLQNASSRKTNTYLHALTAGEEVHSSWVADISLMPHGPLLIPSWSQRLLNTNSPAPWRWTLRLSVGPRSPQGGHVQAAYQFEHTFTIDPHQVANHPSLWQQRLQSDIHAHMSRWTAQLEKRTECEPVQFPVVREGTETFQLQAGSGSGLRPGDRVLLIEPSHIPSRILEPGIAQHLALAQVVRVGQHRSELQQLAGPRLPPHGAWLALPL